MRLFFALFLAIIAASAITPDAIFDLSNDARDQLVERHFDAADKLAEQTRASVLAAIGNRGPDIDPQLALALGASIEVHARVLSATGRGAEAVTFLNEELIHWRATTLVARIHKNLNLLTLEGKPAPSLSVTHFLGPRPQPLSALKGHPVLLFFWAHWCSDCKAEIPIVARLNALYANRGLVIMAPTQHYGYAAHGAEATPAQELEWIEQVRTRYYAAIGPLPVPVSEDAFKVYGVSTTPTLVLLDRDGFVRLYHPGNLSLEDLSARIEKLLR